jgi:hypothetical protein
MALAKAVKNLTGSARVYVGVLILRDLSGPREGCTEPDKARLVDVYVC